MEAGPQRVEDLVFVGAGASHGVPAVVGLGLHVSLQAVGRGVAGRCGCLGEAIYLALELGLVLHALLADAGSGVGEQEAELCFGVGAILLHVDFEWCDIGGHCLIDASAYHDHRITKANGRFVYGKGLFFTEGRGFFDIGRGKLLDIGYFFIDILVELGQLGFGNSVDLGDIFLMESIEGRFLLTDPLVTHFGREEALLGQSRLNAIHEHAVGLGKVRRRFFEHRPGALGAGGNGLLQVF